MADSEVRVVEFPQATVANSVTREDLNEAMSTFRSSVAIEVKHRLKYFLEGVKLSIDLLCAVNPTIS